MLKIYKHQLIKNGQKINKENFWSDLSMFNDFDMSLNEFECLLKRNKLNINNFKLYEYFESEKYVYVYKNIPIKINILDTPMEIINCILNIIKSKNFKEYIPTYLIKNYLEINPKIEFNIGQELIEKMNNSIYLYPANNTKYIFEKYYKNIDTVLNRTDEGKNKNKIKLYKFIKYNEDFKLDKHKWFIKDDYPMLNSKNKNYLLETTINENDIIAKFTDTGIVYVNETGLKSIKKIKCKYRT